VRVLWEFSLCFFEGGTLMHWSVKISLLGLFVLAAASLNSGKAAEPHGMVLFEDQWPHRGDSDFNDQSIAYNYQFVTDATGHVVGLQATFNVLAIGATIHNGLNLHLPVSASAISLATLDTGSGAADVSSIAGQSELDLPLIDDTRSLYPGVSGFINTDPAVPPVPVAHSMQLDIQFSQPVSLDVSTAPFDLFIARTGDRSHQVHLPQYSGTATGADQSLFGTGDDASATGRWFVNKQGLPFALAVPDVIPWPKESTSIELAYPHIVDFAASGGTQATDWYSFPNAQYLYSPAPEPSTLVLAGLGLLGLGFAMLRKQCRRA
jgi:LruC domain-containing protein